MALTQHTYRPVPQHNQHTQHVGTRTYAQSLSRSDLAATGASLTQTLKTIMENEPPHPKLFTNATTLPSAKHPELASPASQPLSNSSDRSSSAEIISNFPNTPNSHNAPSLGSPELRSVTPMSVTPNSPRPSMDPEPYVNRDDEEMNRIITDIRSCKIETTNKTKQLKQLHAYYEPLLKARKAEWMRLRKQIKTVDECGDSLRNMVSQRWTIEAAQPPMTQTAPKSNPVAEENCLLQRLHILLKLKLENVTKLHQIRQQELVKLQRAPNQTIDAIFWVPLNHGHSTNE